MINFLIEQYKASKVLKFLSIFFLLLLVGWIFMYVKGSTDGLGNNIFILVYPLIPLVGGIYGLIFAKKWGGIRSTFGSSITAFALGFLFQFIGQMLYVYYQLYLHIDVPYPSIGDVFYLGSVILYIVGAYQLAKVSGIRLTFNTIQGKLKALLIPFIMLALSYLILLKGYEADWSNKIVVFLDFGYPIGQAVYVSIALLALFISKDILGGLMRKPIMLLIAALIMQFLSDFVFSYQVSREVNTFYAGGINDLMFAFAYFLMALALFSIGNMFYKVQET
jgi:hypothetical protein